MTEQEAHDWLAAKSVPRETMARLGQLIELLTEGMHHQNLIAASTLPHVWARHIVDSVQLLPLAPIDAANWIDLGSGAGFPGLVIGLICPELQVTLVESRRKRIDYLQACTESLGIADRVMVAGARLEMVESRPYDVISARAFAPLDRLLPLAHRFAHSGTRWLLPKGQSAASELAAVEASWQGSFDVVRSATDPDAAIIVAEGVQPKGRRR